MKNVYFILSLLLFTSSDLFSQTWSDDVAQIFYDKCTSCHRPGGAGGFSGGAAGIGVRALRPDPPPSLRKKKINASGLFLEKEIPNTQ